MYREFTEQTDGDHAAASRFAGAHVDEMGHWDT
jgi:hypothetical protein